MHLLPPRHLQRLPNHSDGQRERTSQRLEQEAGQPALAAEEYELAVQADPYDSLAAGDLALLDAGRHRYADAVRLWKMVFEDDPSQLGAGMNLAIVECGLGGRDPAISTLVRLREFAPDDHKADRLLAEIRSGNRKCGTD